MLLFFCHTQNGASYVLSVVIAKVDVSIIVWLMLCDYCGYLSKIDTMQMLYYCVFVNNNMGRYMWLVCLSLLWVGRYMCLVCHL